MKSLEKDRTRRYETANGLAADVERYLHDEPVEACPPSAAYRFRKFARRNRVALLTTGLVAAALVVGTVVSTWQAIRATSAEKLTQTHLGGREGSACRARHSAEQDRERAVASKNLRSKRSGRVRRNLYTAHINSGRAELGTGRNGRCTRAIGSRAAAARS